MRIIHAKSYDDMSRKAAAIISAQLTLKPNSVLGLATGSTPLGLYRQLIDWHEKGDLDFSQAASVNLDEYVGLGPADEQSYHTFMHENLFSHINILPQNTFLPNGLQPDADKECARYEDVIRQLGGIDLQLLGLGHNGHIGFNEPADAFEKNTHCATLTQSTIQANTRFFARQQDVPRKAYTMGIGSIMQARRILVVASGKEKAQAIHNAFLGPITPQVPASILQLHPNTILVGDADALSMI